MRRRSTGFTLIEVMVVVAIVAILSAIAVGAYNDYIRESKTAKVIAHYRVAIDYVKFHYGNAHIQASQGRIPNPAVPDTSAEWAALVDWEGIHAPGGGPAFIAGAGDATTGAIGIAVAGTWADSDSQVTITRPAFAQLALQSIVVTQDL